MIISISFCGQEFILFESAFLILKGFSVAVAKFLIRTRAISIHINVVPAWWPKFVFPQLTNLFLLFYWNSFNGFGYLMRLTELKIQTFQKMIKVTFEMQCHNNIKQKDHYFGNAYFFIIRLLAVLFAVLCSTYKCYGYVYFDWTVTEQMSSTHLSYQLMHFSQVNWDYHLEDFVLPK